MLAFLLSFAAAEPPLYVSLEDGVAKAHQIVVATPLRVEFEALAEDEVLERTTLDNFWVEYRVEQVLKGGLEKGKTIRARSAVVGCVLSDVKVQREGDAVVEIDVHSGAKRALDASSWLTMYNGPPVLFLENGKPFRSLHVSDDVNGDEGIAAIEALLKH